MSRRSRSPQRRIGDEDHSPQRGGSGYSSRRDREKPSRWADAEPGSSRKYPSSRDDGEHRQREEGSRYSRNDREYDERGRERERARDRERYDSGRDRDTARDGDRRDTSSRNHRRSASPPARNSRPRDTDSRAGSQEADALAEKLKPNFAPSGLLAAETNTVKAVDGSSTVLKYNEPPEARKPIIGWRLYVFKDAEQVGTCLCCDILRTGCVNANKCRAIAYSSPKCLPRW